MMPVDPAKSQFEDGLIAEAIVAPDGTWVALNAEGRPIRFADLDDFETIEAILKWRPPEETIR